MNNIITLFLLSGFLTSSCAHKAQKVSPTKYLELHIQHAPLHGSCLEHQQKVLLPPIKESENPDLDDETYYFARNEKQALTFIRAFNVNQFTLKENQMEYEAIIKACVTQRDPSHQTCDTLLPAYKFFRGLIHGMNQYQWSASTKKQGVAITTAYIKEVAKSQASIMDVLLANDLLKRLSERGHVSKELLASCADIRQAGEDSFKNLKKKLQKFRKKDLSCADAISFYDEERKTVQELSLRLSLVTEKLP
jgi:hypothetical protein